MFLIFQFYWGLTACGNGSSPPALDAAVDQTEQNEPTSESDSAVDTGLQ